MHFLIDLWLPIMLSSVLVFVVSSILHMVLPLHRGDFDRLPDEDDLLEAMRAKGVRPGQYMFPRPASMKDMTSPATKARFKAGPVGTMIVQPSPLPSLGRALLQWYAYCLVVSVLVAYLASLTLTRGEAYGPVVRIVSTAAFLGYGVYALQDSIWKGQRWAVSAKFVFDGLVYALVTAGAFAAFGPR